MLASFSSSREITRPNFPMSDKYDPQSHDAVLSRILANQENAAEQARIAAENMEIQMRELRHETRSGFAEVSNRVGALELFRANLKGKVAAISSVVGLLAAAIGEWIKAHIGGGSQ